MNKLILSNQTAKSVKLFLNKPGQAVLLHGESGSGKFALALQIAADVLGVAPAKISDYPYLTHVKRADSKQDIPIEAIRQISKKAELKVPGHNRIRQIALIENAQDMSLPAQNALLKVLEEPPPSMLFILTVDKLSNVLPTVSSRTTPISVNPVNLKQATDYFASEPSQLMPAWRLSRGRAGLLSALLDTSAEHELKKATTAAKQLVNQDPYIALKTLEASDIDFTVLLTGLERVVEALDRAAINNGDFYLHSRLLKQRQLILAAQQAKLLNANEKLLILNLALNLRLL